MDRIENDQLRTKYSRIDCVACGRNWLHCDVSGHHIVTRGAWGPDIEENLMPLCLKCHINVHSKGLGWLAQTHDLQDYLRNKNFEFVESLGKWRNYNICKIINGGNF